MKDKDCFNPTLPHHLLRPISSPLSILLRLEVITSDPLLLIMQKNGTHLMMARGGKLRRIPEHYLGSGQDAQMKLANCKRTIVSYDYCQFSQY